MQKSLVIYSNTHKKLSVNKDNLVEVCPDKTIDTNNDELNQHLEQGWKVVQICPFTPADWPQMMVIIVK